MRTEIDFNKPIPKDLQGPDPKVCYLWRKRARLKYYFLATNHDQMEIWYKNYLGNPRTTTRKISQKSLARPVFLGTIVPCAFILEMS